MKIKDMNKEELRNYHKIKMKEWRLKNRKRDLELKKKWRDNNKDKRKIYQKDYEKRMPSEVKERRRKYLKEYMKFYRKKYFKKHKEYMNNYLKRYMEDEAKYNKHLQRQRDYSKFRKKLIEIYKKCQKCSSKENLETHHLTYLNPTINSITILCRNCHRQLHRLEN